MPSALGFTCTLEVGLSFSLVLRETGKQFCFVTETNRAINFRFEGLVKWEMCRDNFFSFLLHCIQNQMGSLK